MHEMTAIPFLAPHAEPSAAVSPCGQTTRENAALHGDVSVLARRRMR